MRIFLTFYLLVIVINVYSQHIAGITTEQPRFDRPYSNAKLNELNCDTLSSFSTGTYACWGLDNEGNYFWVSLTGYYDYIFKLDTLGNKVDSVSVPYYGSGANYADIEVNDNILWTVNESSSKLIKVNLTSGSILLETDLPNPGFDGNYFSVAFDGQFLWVLNYLTPTFETRLYKMDTATHAVLDSIDLAHQLITIEMVGSELWGVCPVQCFPVKMFSINLSTGGFTDSAEWCITASPYGMAWDGNYLWQSEAFNHLIKKIDIGLQSSISPAASISGSTLVAFPNPACRTLEFSTSGMKGILIIRNTSGAEVQRIEMNGKNISLSVDAYTAGIYAATLYSEDGRLVSTVRFAVQK